MTFARTVAALALAALATGCGDPSTLADPGVPSRTSSAGTLSVGISGPSHVQFNNLSCEWHAWVRGGVAPYTYDWTNSRTTVHTYDPWYFQGFGNNVTITLTVTDALGQTATDTHAVTVNSFGPPCNT